MLCIGVVGTLQGLDVEVDVGDDRGVKRSRDRSGRALSQARAVLSVYALEELAMFLLKQQTSRRALQKLRQ